MVGLCGGLLASAGASEVLLWLRSVLLLLLEVQAAHCRWQVGSDI
jgi:hypothetical protein